MNYCTRAVVSRLIHVMHSKSTFIITTTPNIPYCVYIKPQTLATAGCLTLRIRNTYFVYTAVFRDRRLVIAATYFDKYYSQMEEHSKIPPETIKADICKTIHGEVGEAFSEDMVIPVSGQWARAARLLKHCPKDAKYRRNVLKCLERYDEGPGGQGEKNELQPSQFLAAKLEQASGLIKLEER